MGKRITIVIDDEIMKKIRHIQSKQILKEQRNVSISRVINEKLIELLKK